VSSVPAVVRRPSLENVNLKFLPIQRASTTSGAGALSAGAGAGPQYFPVQHLLSAARAPSAVVVATAPAGGAPAGGAASAPAPVVAAGEGGPRATIQRASIVGILTTNAVQVPTMDQQIRVLTPSEIMRTLPSLGQESYERALTPATVS